MLSIAFLEPHLKRFGGIRRIVELSNALVQRGHEVTIYVPSWERQACDWMTCHARIAPIREQHESPHDALVFNQETQWYLLERFVNARIRVLYSLHFGKLYGKEGSWEALRVPVDLRLANSAWTADMVEKEVGARPYVLLGGVNPHHFRPVDVPKRYPILTMGGNREWKGTSDVEDAARRLDLPLEKYDGKNLTQEEMAGEYSAAEVFAVGSWFEGFGQPGLESLACGTPLVTTDNGGCREYAFHEETALVVPPRDPASMAEAIQRLRSDRTLAARLRQQGLELVRDRFSWQRAADEFAAHVERTMAETPDEPARTRLADRELDGWTVLRPLEVRPRISVVVLAWDQLTLTQRCVESIRQHTHVPYELVLVDNGSAPDASDYARQAGDRVKLNEENRGFAAGMNDGLSLASADVVAFLNNDTEVPDGWAALLLETLDRQPTAGIVVPALTEAGNVRTVRALPGTGVERLRPFEPPPSAVCYVMRTDVVRALGGWDESYAIASGEDLDLAFSVWVNELDVIYDSRVLVSHVGHATSDVKLPDRKALWSANRQQFLGRWSDPMNSVPKLRSCPDDRFERNRAIAASVADWMARYFAARERADEAQSRAFALADLRPSRSAAVHRAVRTVWPRLRTLLPRRVRERLWPYVRDVYYRYFPDRHPAALRGEHHRKSGR